MASEQLLRCASCGEARALSAFSKAQRGKADAVRRCAQCVCADADVPAPRVPAPHVPATRAPATRAPATHVAVQFTARVSDNVQDKDFETTVQLDARGVALACSSVEAATLLIREAGKQTEPAVLRLAQWRCCACDAPGATRVVHNVMCYFNRVPPSMHDNAKPVCELRGPCEAQCRAGASLLAAEIPGLARVHYQRP